MTLPSRPENTSTRDPLVHLLGVMAEGQNGYITGMEADGQRQLLASDVLPVDAPWVELEALGFTRTGPAACDDLFVGCTLPEGWKREGSDHAMWSYIVDERGVRRVAIFYKAAFYDRRAAAHIELPGRSLATEAIYGEEPAALPSAWGVLTEDERADFRESLGGYLDRAAEHPGIYGDRVARVQKLRELAAHG